MKFEITIKAEVRDYEADAILAVVSDFAEGSVVSALRGAGSLRGKESFTARYGDGDVTWSNPGNRGAGWLSAAFDAEGDAPEDVISGCWKLMVAIATSGGKYAAIGTTIDVIWGGRCSARIEAEDRDGDQVGLSLDLSGDDPRLAIINEEVLRRNNVAINDITCDVSGDERRMQTTSVHGESSTDAMIRIGNLDGRRRVAPVKRRGMTTGSRAPSLKDQGVTDDIS